mgnify:CR=1 FL=1
MISTLKRILKHPHRAVFDKSPDAESAFRFSWPAGDMTWTVSDGTMTVVVPAQTFIYDLSQYTVGSLINRLRVDRFEVGYDTARLFSRSATVLLDATGGSAISNGNLVTGYTSLLWALYASYALELKRAKEQVVQALRQMIIWQSEGEWTDVWGALFGVGRNSGEADPGYATRIPKEAFRIRVNKYAIELAIRDLTGQRVMVEETWPDMFRLDESTLSSRYRFPSADQYRYGYLQPTAKALFDWTGVLEVIERNKAAGVIVLPPRVEVSYLVDGRLDGTIDYGILAAYGAYVTGNDSVRLDWMQLGNSAPHRNWRAGVSTNWVINVPDHLRGLIVSGLLDERQGIYILFGTDGFKPMTPIRESELVPIGVNFNNWSRGRKWSDGDKWTTRGASVPRSAGSAMQTTTQ